MNHLGRVMRFMLNLTIDMYKFVVINMKVKI